ncbi:tetratricopeptide repeat protein [Xanthomonas rydalmerensis]|uniref:Tetratricopeptide repeat protein n=1 Tax=Xanthomonas rydalmerensis TaxID=3046274 RepID=A0ABZ0JPT9_9XANT|nr:tetratricopeptide repeat protein [Xanthomonas sp. DM-2023]WOS41831.1 tetratricopeptide repeat protein [Xanthomonas sp. DM-2023]WOS46017.1 tetratricopeptide repeat protein [Xanthomonas sp. DM-2023]WOS50195.1 tetratricopeptide repeat protein [Xanthomonas sp. DM-2023]WOS54375.1 tetratricopeptide repeat protein [Xanthomonas sp. DM-2023]WOS58558.1 tetratricopeptide repeat protein [Xanthomonas sp. DM-2023]
MTRMMEFLQALHLLRPEWLWALLLLPLLGWSWWRRRRRRDIWRRTVDPHLLPHLLARGDAKGNAGLLVGALGYVLAVLALAGPSWRQEQQPLWQARTPLVIALDLSAQIDARDLPPSRLLQARAKLARLLHERAGGEVALLAYAGEPYTVAPLTDDAANVGLFLDALTPQVMPVPGQRTDLAIDWAAQLLRQAGFSRGDILVLSDQADAQAQQAAARAAGQGYHVSALGLGTAQGAAYRDDQGRLAHAQLDAGSLRALATAGAGRYAALTPDDADLRALGVLRPQEEEATAADESHGRVWLDQGYWLLPPLMLLALLAFRRRGGAAVLLLVLAPLAMPLPVHAQAPAAPQAQTPAPGPVAGGWWERADQVRQQRLDAGVQAYRKGDFAAAQQQFEGIDSDAGWYNLGNALARQGRYDEAIDAYDKALKLHPQMADAIANRAAVEAARKRQSSQNSKSGQQGKDGKQQKDGQPQNGQQQSGQQQNSQQQSGKQQDQQQKDQQQGGQQQNGQQGRNGTKDAQQAPPKPGDAQTQQQADAAQRQQMQQAMAQQGGADKQAAERAAAAANETPQQREQRQAVEAWLRRVPDDPGNLLRAKFRLEHERRQREQEP